MFEVGREGSGLLGCLYCVKACNDRLECNTCNAHIGMTDGNSSIAFCSECHLGKKNIGCHKCNSDLAYAPNGFEYTKVFCNGCMGKVRTLKGKTKK